MLSTLQQPWGARGHPDAPTLVCSLCATPWHTNTACSARTGPAISAHVQQLDQCAGVFSMPFTAHSQPPSPLDCWHVRHIPESPTSVCPAWFPVDHPLSHGLLSPEPTFGDVQHTVQHTTPLAASCYILLYASVCVHTTQLCPACSSVD
jgi:hypothetical protein